VQQAAETEVTTPRVGGRIRGLGGPDWVGKGAGEAVRTYGAVSDLRRDLVVMCVTRAGISDMIPGRILWRNEITVLLLRHNIDTEIILIIQGLRRIWS